MLRGCPSYNLFKLMNGFRSVQMSLGGMFFVDKETKCSSFRAHLLTRDGQAFIMYRVYGIRKSMRYSIALMLFAR